MGPCKTFCLKIFRESFITKVATAITDEILGFSTAILVVNGIESTSVLREVVVNVRDPPRSSKMTQAADGSGNLQGLPTETDIWTVVLSFKKSFHLFLQYLRNKLNVFVRHHDLGSLLITVECSSLQTLEELWKDYTSGHLNKVAQETLVTDAVLDKLGLTGVKLTTFISEEEYEKGKQIFMTKLGKVVLPIVLKGT